MFYDLADSAHNLQGQPMFKVLAEIKEMERNGMDIVHFEIGDPDFSTPSNIIDAACHALKNGFTHYSESMGDYDFRKAIQNKILETRGFLPEINQILVSPGANILIYYAVRCLVNPGDEVIIPDPCFPTYLSVLNFCGVKAVPVKLKEENEFRMNPEDVRNAITPNTRLIILNSPHNPTGVVMLPKEVEEIAKIAIENNIYLFSDEIYSSLNYGETPFHSPAIIDKCKDRIIIATGLSKTFAMTGWRIGFAIGPEKVMEKMGLLLQTTSSCVPSFLQKAGIEALTGNQKDVYHMINEYKERRDLLVEKLNEIEGITCLKPSGSFYVFPNIQQTGLDSRTFAAELLQRVGVGLLPGTDFGLSGEGYLRLCYVTSKDNILEGTKRIKQFVESL